MRLWAHLPVFTSTLTSTPTLTLAFPPLDPPDDVLLNQCLCMPLELLRPLAEGAGCLALEDVGFGTPPLPLPLLHPPVPPTMVMERRFRWYETAYQFE